MNSLVLQGSLGNLTGAQRYCRYLKKPRVVGESIGVQGTAICGRRVPLRSVQIVAGNPSNSKLWQAMIQA